MYSGNRQLQYRIEPEPHRKLPTLLTIDDLYALQLKGWYGAFELPSYKDLDDEENDRNKKCLFDLQKFEKPKIVNGVYQYDVIKSYNKDKLKLRFPYFKI